MSLLGEAAAQLNSTSFALPSTCFLFNAFVSPPLSTFAAPFPTSCGVVIASMWLSLLGEAAAHVGRAQEVH
jgi:hypothetical protein